MKNNFIVGIDIGTKQISTIIGQVKTEDDRDEIEVIGYGVADSTGIKRGVIVDMNKTVEDIKKYKLGAIRDDIGEHLLRKIIGPEQKIYLTNHGINSAKQLNSGRIHLWSYEENVAFWFIKKAGFNPNDFEIAYVIEKGSEWYALNKDTNPVIVEEMQKALNQLGETNRNKIINKYLR